MSETRKQPRMLVTIAHYYDPQGDRYFGSTGDAKPALRAGTLSDTVRAFRQLFGARQAKVMNRKRQIFVKVNTNQTYDIDVVICTTQGKHLLDQLTIPDDWFYSQNTHAEPRLLPFECHAILRDRLGDYDYYCYLEDDLIINDPLFFMKLGWFVDRVGQDAILLPNRYELSVTESLAKLYIDGHMSKNFASAFQNIDDRPRLTGKVMGRKVIFERPTNPHSGCFFLNARQMKVFSEKPYFLDRDTSFAGPLESAATQNIMRAFRVYKPAPESAGFLEIHHASNRYLGNWLNKV